MKIDSTFYEEKDNLILRLKYYLNYELSASLLYFLSLFNDIALFLTTLMAIIFTPFMFYVLFKTKRYGWISLFIIILLIPTILSIIILDKFIYITTFLLIELGIFYFYCFILRFVVNDWCEEMKWKIYRNEKKKEKEEKDNLFKKYL